MKRTLNFYLDDSGTRTPNRKPLLFDSGKNEFFALGGVLINEEDEGRVRAAYQELCARWSIDYPPPFNSQTSSLYSPLGSDKFRDTLYELRFKRKSSPMAQIADLYLWPIAMAGYDGGNRAYNLLKSAGRLIESHVPDTQWDERATKYSCFELVRRHERGP